MEKFKALSELLEPDGRQKIFGRILPGGQTRPITLEDIYNRIREIELHDGVPEKIRNHFQTARHLAIYAWFYYPFHVSAMLQGYVCVEFALREKAGVEKGSFKKLLTTAVEKGWIRDEGFSVPRRQKEQMRAAKEFWKEAGIDRPELEEEQEQIDRYCMILCDTLPSLRNSLAHGSSMMDSTSAFNLQICADLIDQLFPMPPPSGTPSVV